MLSSSIRLLQDSSSALQLHNSVQNSLLLLHLHLCVVHFVFDVQPHFTNCNIASGAGSMVVIMGENPPASSFHPYSDGDGIFGLATVSLYYIIH